MKYLSIIFCLVMLHSFEGNAQQQWQWVDIGNNINDGIGNSIATDATGNSYVTGSFNGVFTIGTVTLTSQGGFDIFVAKYDASGQVQWAKSAGGSGHDDGGGIAVDAYGNVYVFSTYSGTANFGDSTFVSDGSTDLSLVKYDNNGTQLWAKPWGGTYTEIAKQISISYDGYIYLTGSFGGGISFDQINLTTQGVADIFVLKLDTSGIVNWAKSAGGSSNDFGTGICADTFGNVYVSGFSGSTMHFGNLSVSDADLFLAKYSNTGIPIWAKVISSNNAGTFGIFHTTDKYGNVYVAGLYYSTSITIGTTTLNNGNNAEKGFIAKYNTNGDVQWAKHMSNAHTDAGLSLALDAMSNIYVGGYYGLSGVYGQDTLTSSGFHDILVAKYDSNGNGVWGVKAGNNYYNEAYNIALDNTGSILATGYISATNGMFGPYPVSTQDGWDMFVAKLSQSTGVRQVREKDNSINVYPNPASGEVIVKLDGNYETALLYDNAGRIVYSAAVKGKKELSIDTKGFASGVYVLQVSGAAGSKQSKIVIE